MSNFQYSKFHLSTEKTKKLFFIKDPIHQEINFSEEQIWLYELVNTPEFQRLGYVQQLGLTHENFPSSTHTRLAHSLGVYEMANKFIKHFLDTQKLTKLENWIEINIALAAALLHDLGHGPKSHAFEKSFLTFKHEQMTIKIIQCKTTKINYLLRQKALQDNLSEEFYVDEICNIFLKKSKYKWIESFISSDLDIDRLDYIVRDKYFCGFCDSHIEYGLLIKWSTLFGENQNKKFLFLEKAKYIVFNFLISRQHMYLMLYSNPISTVYQTLCTEIVKLIKKNLKTKKNQEKYKNVLFLFEKSPDKWNASEFISLNDSVFDQLFLSFKNSKINNRNKKLISLINIYLGDLDNSCYRSIKLNESEYQSYKIFVKKNNVKKSDILFFKKIIPLKSNINTKLLFYNSEQNKEEIISLKLLQEKTRIFFIAIFHQEIYNQWIKYKENE